MVPTILPLAISIHSRPFVPHSLCISGIVPMLSLLTQHGYQLVRLNPNSKPAELLDHQERVRQVELAESNRKKSIAKKVESCYSDRAVKLKSRQDLLSQMIHETLEAHDTLKLRKLSAS
jgi:hypothetical protein